MKFNWKKSLILIGSTITAASPALFVLSCGNNNDSKFEAFDYKGHHFKNDKELDDFIHDNIISKNIEVGQETYVVHDGGSDMTFENYQSAIEYISAKITPVLGYVNPKTDLGDSNVVQNSDFIEEGQTSEYVAFKKSSSKINSSGYTYALKSDLAAVNDARAEAAKTYIDVHNAYYYNGIYFKNLTDLRMYLNDFFDNAKNDDGASEIRTHKETNYFALPLSNGTSPIFELSGNDWTENQNFVSTILQNVTAIYKEQDDTFEINPQNVPNIARTYKEGDLDYIKVAPNGDEITQIVDMDGSTKSGNFYGPYYVSSGQSVDSISNTKSWQKTDVKNIEKREELMEVKILKSAMSFIFQAKGYASPMEVIGATKLPADSSNNDETFLGYLKTLGVNGQYLYDLKNLNNELAKGTRYNILDTIITMHSMLIDKMLENKEEVSDIVMVARYFDSMMSVCDSMLTTFLAPFFFGNEISGNNILKVNYFQSAFNFYDKNALGSGIEFQNNPYSYYRKLLGHKGDTNGEQRHTIYTLLKAALGMQGYTVNSLRRNQDSFSDFLQDSYSIEQIPNITNFSFVGKNAPHDSHEYKSIWANFEDPNIKELNGVLISGFNGKVFTKYNLESNYENYLKIVRNPSIKNYYNNVEKVIGIIKSKLNWQSWNATAAKRLADNLSTLSFIDIDLTGYNSKLITEEDSINKFNKMVESSVKPLSERIAGFINKVVDTGMSVASSVADKMAPVNKANSKREIETSITSMRSEAAIAGTLVKNSKSGVVYAHVAGRKITTQQTIKFKETLYEPTFGKKAGDVIQGMNSKLDSKVESAVESLSENHHSEDRFKSIDSNVLNSNLRIVFNKILLSREKSLTDSEREAILEEVLKFGSNPTEKQLESISDKYSDNNKDLDLKRFVEAVMTTNYVKDSNEEKKENDDSIRKLFSSGGLSNFLEGAGIFGTILDNVIKMASIIPEVAIASTIINFALSWGSSDTIIYSYKIPETESMYWDGGKVEYSWWGLSSSVKSDINDLKMIAPQQIIGGHGVSKSGIYFDGKYHSDLSSLRTEYAKTKLNEIQKIKTDCIKDPSKIKNLGTLKNNFFWKISFIDNTNKESNSLFDLVKNVGTKIQEQNNGSGFNSKVFRTPSGDFTSDASTAKVAWIDDTINSLSRSTIIKLPKVINNPTGNGFNLEKENYFELPKPYWTPSKRLVEPPQVPASSATDDEITEYQKYIISNSRYVIMNPDLLDSDKASNNDVVKASFDRGKLVNMNYNRINSLVLSYAKDYNVDNVTIIYENLRNKNNDTFEKLVENSWADSTTDLYKIDLFGYNANDSSTYYFRNLSAAIDEMGKPTNMNIHKISPTRITEKFTFEDILFNSIKAIKTYVRANKDGVNKNEN